MTHGLVTKLIPSQLSKRVLWKVQKVPFGPPKGPFWTTFLPSRPTKFLPGLVLSHTQGPLQTPPVVSKQYLISAKFTNKFSLALGVGCSKKPRPGYFFGVFVPAMDQKVVIFGRPQHSFWKKFCKIFAQTPPVWRTFAKCFIKSHKCWNTFFDKKCVFGHPWVPYLTIGYP